MIVEVILIKEYGLNRDGVANVVMLPVVAYFLFNLILKLNITGDAKIYRKLRDYSTLIYLSHCYFIRSIKFFISIKKRNI